VDIFVCFIFRFYRILLRSFRKFAPIHGAYAYINGLVLLTSVLFSAPYNILLGVVAFNPLQLLISAIGFALINFFVSTFGYVVTVSVYRRLAKNQIHM